LPTLDYTEHTLERRKQFFTAAVDFIGRFAPVPGARHWAVPRGTRGRRGDLFPQTGRRVASRAPRQILCV